MISQTLEYALRAVVTIAQHEGHPCTAKQIAEITQVPAPYLSKLMQRLVRAGVVHSQRGLHGGFVLAEEPCELTIWKVVDAVEPFQRIHECPLGIKSHDSTLCPLHRRLDRAMEMVQELFCSTTIADVLAEPGAVTPLCQEKKTFMINANIKSLKHSAEESGKKKTKKKRTPAAE
ncbi:MAG: Rrf2 family transcriptional regulator [Planctomycetes bacterium]|nr:Rrf2 family transcriptional regulator [Planctomycetota bacterium]